MSNDAALEAFDGEILDVVVPHGLDAVRVDRAVAMLTGLSRSESHQLVEDGAVSVDDRIVTKASTSVNAGEHLVAILPPPSDGAVEPDASVEIDVVLDGDGFVVINKAPGVVVHPGAGQRDGTLIAGVLARYPQVAELAASGLCDPSRPGVVHRLDKGTSGLLVVATSVDAFHSLSDQLADRTMARTYLGLVEGHVVEDRGVVDAPIGRSTRTPTMMAVRADGRVARTGYRVLARIDKPHAVTLLELKLDTGRTHQIRVHLAAIGHPVVNDTRYGHRRDRRLGEERFFLHSASLGFVHPTTGEPVLTHAALPEELAAMVPDFEGL